MKIDNCPNLKSITESLRTCVSLHELRVESCPNLSSLPGVPSLIRHLEITYSGIEELPRGLQFCTSLKYLKIERCPNLKSIPDLGEVFHSLINLEYSNSPYQRLELLRKGHLKNLIIDGFIEELDAFPILRYPSIRYSHASLKKLILRGSPTLNSLPDEIRLFTALEELRIQKFNRMEALPDWFSYLSSLQKLSLRCCKKLMSLPIPHLTNLKHLHIDYCPSLEERYAEGSGVEWFNIPDIKINGKYIKGGEDSGDFEDFVDSDYGDSDFHDSDDDVLFPILQTKYIPFPTGPQFIYVIFYF